jgi:hypothetical protein
MKMDLILVIGQPQMHTSLEEIEWPLH